MGKAKVEFENLIDAQDKLARSCDGLKKEMRTILSENGIENQKQLFGSNKALEKLEKLKIPEAIKFKIRIIAEQIKSLTKSIKEIEEKIKEPGGL
ncbi:MAG: hypothetical protein LBU55_00205 [Elusimicrobiota bacterium]|jgi:hypothetical protein|nr:hypothetical protein [Elusimicrobiota bacterium]